MTRKTIALLLSFVLLVTQTGLAVSVHYCGGEAVSMAAGFQLKAQGCGMEEARPGCDTGLKLTKKSCCDETTVQLKVKQYAPIVLKAASSVEAVPQPEINIVVPHCRIVVPKVYQFPAFHCDAHGPPLYLLYSSYLLYA